ncbi:DUF397 domain-containing protein, partial [Streptomyces sp. NPDC054835]
MERLVHPVSKSALSWFTSPYSDGSGGNCIEVAFDWHKSSSSDDGGGSCVEVAACPHAVHLRGSKVQDGPTSRSSRAPGVRSSPGRADLPGQARVPSGTCPG